MEAAANVTAEAAAASVACSAEDEEAISFLRQAMAYVQAQHAAWTLADRSATKEAREREVGRAAAKDSGREGSGNEAAEGKGSRDGSRESGEVASPASTAAAEALASVGAAAQTATEGQGKGDGDAPRLLLQAADGQLVFGDALSTRMLLQEFGSISHVPAVVHAPIVELVTHRRTDDATRKRFRWLSHLPQGCSFQVAELNLSGLVSAAVLADNHEQIGKRAENRTRKRREEAKLQREAQQSEREAQQQASKAGRSALGLELELMSMDEVQARQRRQQLAREAVFEIAVGEEWEAQWQAQQETSRQVPSFARMVHEGFAASGPTLEQAVRSPGASPSLSPASCPPAAGAGLREGFSLSGQSPVPSGSASSGSGKSTPRVSNRSPDYSPSLTPVSSCGAGCESAGGASALTPQRSATVPSCTTPQPRIPPFAQLKGGGGGVSREGAAAVLGMPLPWPGPMVPPASSGGGRGSSPGTSLLRGRCVEPRRGM